MKALLLVVTAFFTATAMSEETLVLYSRNYTNPYVKAHIDNIVKLSEEKFGKLHVIKSQDMEQGRAFAELVNGNIDVIVTAPTIERETTARVLYVPLDRGLLGFRICMKNANSPAFNRVRSAMDLLNKELAIGVAEHWPDNIIFRDNGFRVTSVSKRESLFLMLERNRFDCLTRSVMEIDDDIKNYGNGALIEDDALLFLYPNSDFIFINPKRRSLHERLSIGLGMAIEDYSFFTIFEEFYGDTLEKHRAFERKLVFMQNNTISRQALSAINHFGIASFIVPIE
ncbi:hypothetical protein [Glaciecola sp. 1036]|uniref:hypothetical protein n=1 Tax=Alteromonadaceae TaxID=72275 RepID=UPI003D03FBB3